MNLLNKNNVIKKLSFAKKKSGGRNYTGLTVVKHIGGGLKKKYRLIDFFRCVRGIVGQVKKIEYDPNRNAYIGLICYKNSVLSYIIIADSLKINDFIITDKKVMPFSSNSTRIGNIAVGTFIHNLEFFPNAGSKLSRAAGSFCQVLKKLSENYVLIKLKSKEYRVFHSQVFASFGIVSNKFYKFEKLYKAGQTRYRGIRPIVRGEAKNPVDHPHGGNTTGGRLPRTPTGKLTKGVKTRNLRKNTSNFIYKTRHIN